MDANEKKKYSINNMLLAFFAFLAVVGLVALAGFLLLTPPDDIIMGQAEATEVRISGKVPGRIESYRFGEGDRVKAGDTLVFLDTPEVWAKLQQAEAVQKAAEAQHTKAIKGARTQEITGAYELWHSRALRSKSRTNPIHVYKICLTKGSYPLKNGMKQKPITKRWLPQRKQLNPNTTWRWPVRVQKTKRLPLLLFNRQVEPLQK